MPRRTHTRQYKAFRPLNITAAIGEGFVETKRGKTYSVNKTIDGQSVYKCPNCNQSIKIGEPSYTVIEQDHLFGEQAAIDERRHWHLSCWKRFR